MPDDGNTGAAVIVDVCAASYVNMADEPKKLSFGFKKKSINQPKQQEQKQFIDCLEGKSIKVIGGEIDTEKPPLVIPLRPNDKTVTAASLLRIAKEVESGILEDDSKKSDDVTETKIVLPAPKENETLEERATRELMEESLKRNNISVKTESSLVVPMAKNLELQGQKESSLEDYENIPITDFGMAMLRGMGWAPGKGMGKHKSVDLKLPTLRPKGMGLGADRITIDTKNGSDDKKSQEEEQLQIIKGSFVKIIKGKQCGTYGQVTGFDEDSGRLIMKTAIGGENINVNEFMVKAVSKVEYTKFSKVLNLEKYEKYEKNKNNSTINTEERKSKIDSSKHSYREEINESHHRRRNSRERNRESSSSHPNYSHERHSKDKRKDRDRRRSRSRSRNRSRH